MRYGLATTLIVSLAIVMPGEGRTAEPGPALQPGSLPRVGQLNKQPSGVGMPDARVATFGDSLRYADTLGQLARRGVGVAFPGNLASSRYGMVDQKGSTPRPTYWVAQLWRRLMGSVVLDAGPPRDGLNIYAHCRRGVPGGVVLLVVNDSATATRSLRIAGASQRYTLSGGTSGPGEIRLNGRMLRLGPGNAVPMMGGVVERAGPIRLAPTTITFLTIPYASNKHCRTR